MDSRTLYVKELPAWERPRERLMREGAAALSLAELIAVVLGCGSKNIPLMSICNHLVAAAGDSAPGLDGMSISEIAAIRGVGNVKAMSLVAALELGRRCAAALQPLILQDDQAVKCFIAPYFNDRSAVQYQLVLMNQRQELLATSELVPRDGKLPQIGQVIKLCLQAGSSAILICRNETELSNKYLKLEKEFMGELGAAAALFKISMRGLLIVE